MTERILSRIKIIAMEKRINLLARRFKIIEDAAVFQTEPDSNSLKKISSYVLTSVFKQKGLFLNYWPVITLISGYAFTIALLALKHDFIYLSEGIFIPLLMLTALLSWQLTAFMYDWSIYLAVMIFFNAWRGFNFALIKYWHLSIHQQYVIKLEKILTFNLIIPALMQKYFYQNEIITNFDKVLAALYGTHFVVFILLGFVIWLTHREEFWQYKAAFVLLSLIGMICFLICPTMPPWMASQYHSIPQVMPLIANIYNISIPTLFIKFNSDPVASVPSLHAGFAILCTLIACRYSKIWGGIFFIYSIALCLACLILGAHYVVDLIAGGLLGSAMYWLVYHHAYIHRLQPQSLDVISTNKLILKMAVSLIILLTALLLAKLSAYCLLHT